MSPHVNLSISPVQISRIDTFEHTYQLLTEVNTNSSRNYMFRHENHVGVKNLISEKIIKIKIFLDRSISLGEISPNPKRFFKLTYLFTNSVPE